MNKKIAHQLITKCRELTDYITSSRICRKEITRREPLGTNLSLNMNSVRFPSRKVKTQREISCPAISIDQLSTGQAPTPCRAEPTATSTVGVS